MALNRPNIRLLIQMLLVRIIATDFNKSETAILFLRKYANVKKNNNTFKKMFFVNFFFFFYNNDIKVQQLKISWSISALLQYFQKDWLKKQ